MIAAQNAGKTRVVIFGENDQTNAAKLFLHTVHFLGKEISHKTSFSENSVPGEFIIFEAEKDLLSEYAPTILLFSNHHFSDNHKLLIRSVTPGGMVIYNADNAELQNFIENSENHFRKIPYSTPVYKQHGTQIFIQTDLGEIPVRHAETLHFLDGVKLLSQHIGIMEEDFYEALTEF